MKKLLVLAAVLLVSACGVKPTGVVAAGPAPTLRNPGNPGRDAEMVLYFVLDGRAAPVTRPIVDGRGAEAALSTLLDGPTEAERSDGYLTDLPRRAGSIGLVTGPPATITVSFPLKAVGALGVNQLVCTAFAALAAEGRYPTDGTLAVSGPDVQLPYQACQAS